LSVIHDVNTSIHAVAEEACMKSDCHHSRLVTVSWGLVVIRKRDAARQHAEPTRMDLHIDGLSRYDVLPGESDEGECASSTSRYSSYRRGEVRATEHLL
jgi:hypothetical protein